MTDRAFDSLVIDLWGDFQNTQVLWQATVIVLVLAGAWGLMRWVRSRSQGGARAQPLGDAAVKRRQFARLSEGILPLFASAILESLARVGIAHHRHAHLLRMAALLLLALGIIRLVFYAVQRAFKPSGFLAVFERLFAAVVLLVVALHVTGLLPDVLDALDVVVYRGPGMAQPITLLQIGKGAFWIGVTLIAALWAGAALDARLTAIDSLDASLRAALARFSRAALVVIAVLMSMEAVGIPLGVLSVFGGALGVGLGLGLQRIASNYVSGFIILLDRSLRIGDLITVDKYHGAVTQIRTRYTVIKSLDGTEAILPNELLVSGAVLNHSYTSKQLRVSIKLQIAYESDLDHAMAIMLDAARAQARVLTDPAPIVTLNGFGVDGLELELGFWVPDPELGTGSVRSDISRQILSEFKAQSIAIPYARRDVRVWMVDEPVQPAQGDSNAQQQK